MIFSLCDESSFCFWRQHLDRSITAIILGLHAEAASVRLAAGRLCLKDSQDGASWCLDRGGLGSPARKSETFARLSVFRAPFQSDAVSWREIEGRRESARETLAL
jgi:hypothetical protein